MVMCDVRVGFFVGREFSAEAHDSKLGWVICAAAHARELVSPVPLEKLKEWELVVMEPTVVAPGLFYMPGYAHLTRALRSFRGDHRVRDPGTLFKCEICPSPFAPLAAASAACSSASVYRRRRHGEPALGGRG